MTTDDAAQRAAELREGAKTLRSKGADFEADYLDALADAEEEPEPTPGV